MATVIGTNKKQELGCRTFLLQVRYGAADAKVALQQYVKNNPHLAKNPMTHTHVLEIFYKYGHGYLSRKNMKSLVEFLFNQAEKNNYIVTVPRIWSDDEIEYIISPSINDKRPGPKKKADSRTINKQT